MRKYLLLLLFFFSLVTQVFGGELSWQVTEKLAQNAGDATVSYSSFTFKFTKVSGYQSSYVKMVGGSGLTISSSNKNITKIEFGYSDGRTKTLSFTSASSGTLAEPVWTGNAQSIAFTASGSGEFSLSKITITYSDEGTLSFPEPTKTYSLVDLESTGQKAVSSVSGVTITYETSNPKIVQVDNNGNLRFVNAGIASVKATGSNGAMTSYSVVIAADTASYMVKGNTYTLTGAGKLRKKVVTDIAGMTMQFGADKEITVVREVNGKIGAATIDENGYKYTDALNTIPQHGTYYVFKPTNNGELNVKGFTEMMTGSNANTVQLRTADGTQIGNNITAGNIDANFTLEAGKIYYLYTNYYNWFYLTSFTFNSSISFKDRAVKVEQGATGYTQTVQGGTGVKYTAQFLGDVKGSINESTGAVTFSNKEGGAVVVTATAGSASVYYVITVPYTAHTWTFDSSTMPANELKNMPGWTLDYKTKQYSGSTLTYLNAPVMANGYAFEGTNAHRIPATAGLWFKAGSSSFGGLAVINGVDEMSLDEQLQLPVSSVSNITALTVKQGTVMTIPSLKAGQYVKIKWERHSEATGDRFKVTNLLDLDGNEMTQDFQIGSLGNGYGYAMFKVKADGDVTFTGINKGWTNIYSLQVYAPGEKGQTELRVVDTANRTFENHIDYMIVDGKMPENTEKTIQYSTRPGAYSHGQSGLNRMEYSLKSSDGVMATITPDGNFTVKGGQGTVVIVLKEITDNGYVLDKVETPIAINRGYQTTIKYPYTWDFQGREEEGRKIPSTETFDSFGKVTNSYNKVRWMTNTDGTFGVRAVDDTYNVPRFVNGSELWLADDNGDGKTIREFRGLRLTLADLNADNTNQVKVGNNGALSIGTVAEQKITLPAVPVNAKIYVRGTKQSGAVLACNGAALTAVDGTTDVYMTQVSEAGDAVLTVKGVDIYQLGVSVDDKKISAAGAATEARGYDVNYDYAKLFLGKELKAYTITGVNDDNTQLLTQEMQRVKAGTGVMVRPAEASGGATVWPLFTTDINDNTLAADNKLIGVVTPPAENIDQTSTVEGTEKYNYLLANSGYDVHYTTGATTGKVEKAANGLGFYLVLKQGTRMGDGSVYPGGKPKANSAYLQLPVKLIVHTGTDADQTVEYPAKHFYSLFFAADDPDSSVTGIDSLSDGSDMSKGIQERQYDDYYYTLSGVRVAHPTKGVYIHNGKKVVIK